MTDGNVLERRTSRYVLSFGHARRGGGAVLRVRSATGGRHFADHTRFNLLADDGQVIDSRPITEEVARFIMAHFHERGDTASFDVYESDLHGGALVLGAARTLVEPGQVRHRLTTVEQSYTATGAKLAQHRHIFQKLRETGFGSIIRATMTLHQVCSSRCHYCSTIQRNRKDSVTLREAQEFVSKLDEQQARFNQERFGEHNRRYRALTGADIRLRGLILSGGGQPNLWPDFAQLVDWLAEREIKLGLITNGFPRSVPERIYEHFAWVRISITPGDASPHYPDGRFDRQYLPSSLRDNPNVTVGYSYVYGPWTDDEIFRQIADSLEQNGFAYCRTLVDCNLPRGEQLRAHQALAERLMRLGYLRDDGQPLGRIFHQLKYHGTPEQAAELWTEGQCFLQAYNVFWDTTGHELHGKSSCYACDSITVLAEEPSADGVVGVARLKPAERRFDHGVWGTVTNDEVERLYTEPLRPFFDPRKVCSACLFMRNNQTVKELTRATATDEPAFIPGLTHVEFP